MSRKNQHQRRRIVELSRTAPREPEHCRERIGCRDRVDRRQRRAQHRSDCRIRVDGECECDIVRRHWPPIMPSRITIHPEGDRRRVTAPLPVSRKLFHEAGISDRIHRDADIREILVDELCCLACLGGERRGRKQCVGVRCRGDDDRASRFAADGRTPRVRARGHRSNGQHEHQADCRHLRRKWTAAKRQIWGEPRQSPIGFTDA